MLPMSVRFLLFLAPELASLISVTSLGTAEIQTNIPKDETLIEYYYADNVIKKILQRRTSSQAFGLVDSEDSPYVPQNKTEDVKHKTLDKNIGAA
jgi:hypothetical protein